MEQVHDAERLKELQALPLDRKIQISQARIIEWYQRWNGNVIVSFSGGKDSTVLLHLVRTIYPDVPAVFSNTGLEYGEIQRFVRSFPNVQIVAPKMRFDQVISKYGYPLIGKEVAEAIYYARRLRSQSIHVERERENKPLPCGVNAENFSASELAGGDLETSFRRAEPQTDGQSCKANGGGQKPPDSAKRYTAYGAETHRRRNDLTAQWHTAGLQADRVGGGTEAQPVDGGLSEVRRDERQMGLVREEKSRGSKWGDYHRRSLNNDPVDPRDRECFFNRDPSKTDWNDWRRGCL